MATLEERLGSLEGDYVVAMQRVAAKLDGHAALQREQSRDIRELGRDVREQGQEIREMKMRLGTVETRLGTVDSRLNRIDERLLSLQEEMNLKFDQIIALLSQAKGG